MTHTQWDLGNHSRFHTTSVRDEKYGNVYSFTVPRRYSNLQFINAGTQGGVVSADDSVERRRVAIKKMHRPFVHLTSARRAYREIILLSSVKHPNIIETYSVFTPQQDPDSFQEVYLVMELMTYNLNEVVSRHASIIDHKMLSFFIYQMLCAVNHLHRCGIIHRDLKPSNLVINERSIIKVLDFGLARLLTPTAGERMSGYVVTRHYRAPEVVLELPYCEKVDVWSIGCICAELINRRVLFPGKDRLQQWMEIISVMGTPSESFISRLGDHAANYLRSLPPSAPKFMDEILPDHNFLASSENPLLSRTANDARRLISKMLAIDPNERISVADALHDPYVRAWFKEEDVCPNMSATTKLVCDNWYNREIDVAGHSLSELKSLIFDEVKRIESMRDIFGGI